MKSGSLDNLPASAAWSSRSPTPKSDNTNSDRVVETDSDTWSFGTDSSRKFQASSPPASPPLAVSPPSTSPSASPPLVVSPSPPVLPPPSPPPLPVFNFPAASKGGFEAVCRSAERRVALALRPPPWLERARSEVAKVLSKPVPFSEIVESSPAIFADLGFPADLHEPDSDGSAMAFSSLTTALRNAEGNGTPLSPTLTELVRSVSFSGVLQRSRASRPATSIWMGTKVLDANRLTLGSNDSQHYIASASPGGFGMSIRQYVETLWNEGATAAVSLVPAWWWPNEGEVEIGGPIQARVNSVQTFTIPAAIPNPLDPFDTASCHRSSQPEGEASVSILRVSLTRGLESRELTVAETSDWPDFAPLHGQTLEALCSILESNRTPGPTAVHCLGGCGRTGTFVLAHVLHKTIHQVQPEKRFAYAMQVFLAMRLQRSGLIETSDQWNAALDAAYFALGQSQSSQVLVSPGESAHGGTHAASMNSETSSFAQESPPR